MAFYPELFRLVFFQDPPVACSDLPLVCMHLFGIPACCSAFPQESFTREFRDSEAESQQRECDGLGKRERCADRVGARNIRWWAQRNAYKEAPQGAPYIYTLAHHHVTPMIHKGLKS
jgi:hypothetical protein